MLNPSNARATFVQSTWMQIYEDHLNPVTLVFFGFQLYFNQVLVHNFVLAKLATSSIRVKASSHKPGYSLTAI